MPDHGTNYTPDGFRKMWERPHEYEGKIVGVGPAGIFHARTADAPGATRCGLVLGDEARRTDHKLLDHQPCHVCFEVRDA